jgi:hypothetical protein
MKYVTALFVLVSLMLGSVQAQAGSNEVIFTCDLPSGKHVLVEHNPTTDVFILSYGLNIDMPELTIMKRGTNLGTSAQMSREEGILNRELYVTDGEKFYNVTYTDKQGTKYGSFQIMQGGVETSYETCDPKSLRSKFDDYQLFENMTVVD